MLWYIGATICSYTGRNEIKEHKNFQAKVFYSNDLYTYSLGHYYINYFTLCIYPSSSGICIEKHNQVS